MNNYTNQQLKQLAIARQRPMCLYLGELDKKLQQQLTDYYFNSAHNTLQHAIFQRQERNIPTDHQSYLYQHYRQLQIHPAVNKEKPPNTLFNLDLSIINTLTQALGPLNRIRISSLAPCASLPLHIDDPLQNRAIALLAGNQTFTINTKNNHFDLDMQQGEIWFVNTTWPHTVHNPGTQPRLALLLDLQDLPTNPTNKRKPCDANNKPQRQLL